MSNFKRKSALALAMLLTFVTVFGVLKPEEAKAWTNLTIAQFDTIYEHNGSKEVTYKLTLPSSGKLTQITSVTGEYVNFYIYDASEKEVQTLYGNATNTYTYDMNLIGGDYYIKVTSNWDKTAANFKWVFTPSEESFNETQDDRNNDLSSKFQVAVGQTVKGQLALNDNVDYYGFSVNKTGALNLKLTAKMEGMELSLLNDEGSFNYKVSDIIKGTKTLTFQIPKGSYSLMCSGNKTGNYQFTTSFVSGPSKVKLASVRNIKTGKLKASWKKVKSVKGYEVQISTTGDFSSDVTTKLVKGAKKTSFTFKGLNISNSWRTYTYYCRVRAYKEKNKIKAYSDWSNEKEVTIKR